MGSAYYEALLDFSIPPGFLNTVRAVVKVKDVLLDYIVPRPSEVVYAAQAAHTTGKSADYTSYWDLGACLPGT
jgi:hypothetical protein